MLEFKIQLKGCQSVQKFVNMMDKVPGSAMLVDKERRVNAKSLLGVFNTPKTAVVTLQLDCEEKDIEAILPYINQCCIKTED